MSKNKHIIHLISNKEWGGGEQYVFDLCQHLTTNNYNVKAFCRPIKQIIEHLSILDISLYNLPLKGFTDLFSAFRLSSHLKNKQHVIIHVHNFKDAFTAVYARIISGNKNARVILTRHLVRKGKTSPIYNWLYKQLDKIIFVSELAKNEFFSTKPTIDSEKVTVVKNAIIIPHNIYKVDIRKEFSLPADCTVAMYHGRIAAEKGLNILIDAMQLLKDKEIYLLLIGKGNSSYTSSLQQQINDYGLENKIKLIGFRSSIHSYLKECDFGILPSIVEESSSLSCMEYMSQGRTVIATNNGGQTEYLVNENNSLLIPPGDSKILAEKILELTNDKKKCIFLGENARKDYMNKLNYNIFFKQIINIYG